MKYAIEVVTGIMLYIPSVVKTGSAVQKLIGRIYRHTDRMEIAYSRKVS
jgi:hypothetical protein